MPPDGSRHPMCQLIFESLGLFPIQLILNQSASHILNLILAHQSKSLPIPAVYHIKQKNVGGGGGCGKWPIGIFCAFQTSAHVLVLSVHPGLHCDPVQAHHLQWLRVPWLVPGRWVLHGSVIRDLHTHLRPVQDLQVTRSHLQRGELMSKDGGLGGNCDLVLVLPPGHRITELS